VANWVLKGLRMGIRSGGYPDRVEDAPGISPGRPVGSRLDAAQAESLARRCPTGALVPRDGGVAVEQGRCVHCFRCRENGEEGEAAWETDYEWAACSSEAAEAQQKLARIFGRSLHIRFVDAGACGACVSEARQLNNPYYNMHRLGFFVTPTPRNADVLLVAGPVSDAMRLPLQKVHDAMPPPKRVVAIGACAISGGVFGPSFAALGGAHEIIPVDVVVPGCPPPPLAILHGLLLVVERKPPAALVSLPP
jgi:Ni,Fe-hydrogenase III small subunit/ferredoxin-like protein FixX